MFAVSSNRREPAAEKSLTSIPWVRRLVPRRPFVVPTATSRTATDLNDSFIVLTEYKVDL